MSLRSLWGFASTVRVGELSPGQVGVASRQSLTVGKCIMPWAMYCSSPFLLACVYLSIYLSIHPSIYLSIYPSIHLSIHPSIHPSIDWSRRIAYMMHGIDITLHREYISRVVLLFWVFTSYWSCLSVQVIGIVMTLHDMLHRVPVLKLKARPQEDFAGPLCSGRALGGAAVGLILTLDVTRCKLMM